VASPTTSGALSSSALGLTGPARASSLATTSVAMAATSLLAPPDESRSLAQRTRFLKSQSEGLGSTFRGRPADPAVPNWASALEKPVLSVQGKPPHLSVFQQYDASGDGKLNSDEVAALIKGMGFATTEDYIAGLIQVVDTDHSGRVEYGEFAKLWELLEKESQLAPYMRKVQANPAARIDVASGGNALHDLGLGRLLDSKLTGEAVEARQLRDACRVGNMAVVRNMLDRGVNVEDTDSMKDFETVLMLAAQGGHAEVVGALLAAGASPNCATAAGWTALHRAAMWGQAGTTMALVRGGASIHAKDRYGNTPREIALQYGRAEVAAFLTSVGAPDALGNVGMQTDAGGQRHKQVLSASLASVSSRPVEIAEDKL
jgi:hypothetical protein